MPTASVIVSAYDIPFSLRLAMLGYQRQSCKDFELIIADDGSGSETADSRNRHAHSGERAFEASGFSRDDPFYHRPGKRKGF